MLLIWQSFLALQEILKEVPQLKGIEQQTETWIYTKEWIALKITLMKVNKLLIDLKDSGLSKQNITATYDVCAYSIYEIKIIITSQRIEGKNLK